jgi:hypothetical protein
MPNTMSVSPISPFIEDYLANHAGDINAFAGATGVPATAIAGAVAEEMRNVYLEEPSFSDGPGNYGTTVFENPTDAVLDALTTRSTSDRIASDFQNRLAQIQQGIAGGPIDKITSPTANDIGPANINLGHAIQTLQNYLSNPAYANDPLLLKQYENNYQQFAKDLTNLNSTATFAIAGRVPRSDLVRDENLRAVRRSVGQPTFFCKGLPTESQSRASAKGVLWRVEPAPCLQQLMQYA